MQHVYPLGSSTRASRLAVGLKRNLIFRAAAGDCGQLLASSERMSRVGPSALWPYPPAGCASRIGSPLTELVTSGAELRVVADLRGLADAVAAPSLAFCCIRMRKVGDWPAQERWLRRSV